MTADETLNNEEEPKKEEKVDEEKEFKARSENCVNEVKAILEKYNCEISVPGFVIIPKK